MESTQESPKTADRSVPYKPSMINRLSNVVERRPGSSWFYYAGFWLVLVIAQVVVLWVEGGDPLQNYHVAQAFLAGATAFMLGLFLYFDRRAASALSLTRPVLTIDDEEYKNIEYRLTTLPFGGALVAGITAIGVLLLSEALGTSYWLEPLAAFPISAIFLRIVYFICWGVFGVFIYQTLHRLGLINGIYTQHTRINLFLKKPLYALSNLTALTAGSVTVLPLGFLLSNNLMDLDLLDPASIIVVLFIQAIAFLSFLWPQLGIQRLQRAEKDRLLDEVNQRYQKTFLELHKRIDNDELENSSALDVTLTMLEKELKNVKRIPIWPWEPETVRWLVTGLVLPIGFMILQLILQRIFN